MPASRISSIAPEADCNKSASSSPRPTKRSNAASQAVRASPVQSPTELSTPSRTSGTNSRINAAFFANTSLIADASASRNTNIESPLTAFPPRPSQTALTPTRHQKHPCQQKNRHHPTPKRMDLPPTNPRHPRHNQRQPERAKQQSHSHTLRTSSQPPPAPRPNGPDHRTRPSRSHPTTPASCSTAPRKNHSHPESSQQPHRPGKKPTQQTGRTRPEHPKPPQSATLEQSQHPHSRAQPTNRPNTCQAKWWVAQ